MPHYTSSSNVSGVALSSDDRINALLPVLPFDNADEAPPKWGDGPAGTAATVAYSFPGVDALWSTEEGLYSPSENPFSPQDAPFEGFQPLDAGQQTRFEAALAEWAAVANIAFVEQVETPDGQVGDIRVAISTDVSDDGRDSWTFFPIDENITFGVLGGDLWLSPTVEAEPDAHRFWIYLTNIGTAIGLDNTETGAFRLETAFDNWAYSLMSFNTGESAHPLTPAGPMLYDILALQYLYGPNMAWQTGDDVYAAPAAGTIDCIWDAGGIDTITAAGVAGGAVIDLSAGAFSRLGSTTAGASNLSIAFGVTIENAIGSAGADTIMGNVAANSLIGGDGNDILYGGTTLAGGSDVVIGGAGRDTGYGGDSGDLILGDNRSATAYGATTGDMLLGDSGVDLLIAGTGSDAAYGGSDADWVAGEQDADVVWGGDGDDFLDGGTSADVLNGEAGADVLIGGEGSDTLYGGSEADFLAGEDVQASGPGAADFLSGESGSDVVRAGDGADIVYGGGDDDLVEAGAGNDVASGDDGNDILVGAAGNDRLFGGTGDDSLAGGTGNDTLSGGAGSDTMLGGAGTDSFAIGSGSDGDLIVDWDPGDAIDVSAAGIASFGVLTLTAIVGGMRVSGAGLSIDVMLDAGESLAEGDFRFA